MNSSTAKRCFRPTLMALTVALPCAMASAQVQKPAQKQAPAKSPVTRAPLPNGPVVVKPMLQVQPGQGACEDGFLWNEIDSTCNPIGESPGTGGGGGSGGTTTLDPVVITSPPKTPPAPPPTTNPVETTPPGGGVVLPQPPKKSPEDRAAEKARCDARYKLDMENLKDEYTVRSAICTQMATTSTQGPLGVMERLFGQWAAQQCISELNEYRDKKQEAFNKEKGECNLRADQG